MGAPPGGAGRRAGTRGTGRFEEEQSGFAVVEVGTGETDRRKRGGHGWEMHGHDDQVGGSAERGGGG